MAELYTESKQNSESNKSRTARAVCTCCGQAIPPEREIVHCEGRFTVIREAGAFVVNAGGPGGVVIRVSGAYESADQAKRHIADVKAALLADLAK